MFHFTRRLSTIVVLTGFILLFSSVNLAQSASSSPRQNPEFQNRLSGIVVIDSSWASSSPTRFPLIPRNLSDLLDILGDVPLGPNVLCNQDQTTQAQNEPSIDVDPSNPNHIVASSNDYRLKANPGGDVRAGYYASFDGGNTWPGDGIIDISSIPNTNAAGDPAMAIHDLNNVYFNFIAFSRNTDDAGGVAVSKSTDGGITWQTPVVVAWNSLSVFHDKNYIAVDATGSPYDGNVYVTWTRFEYDSPIYFSRSTNGGSSFSAPFAISDAAHSSNQGSIPVVGPDGTLYVAWYSYYPDSIRINKSTNGGQSFGTAGLVASVNPIPYNLPGGNFRDNSFPTMAVDPTNGNIYVAWSDFRNNDADIYFTRSTDGGNTWSAAVRINDDPLYNNAHQFFPWMDVAPNGKIYVGWFDSRLDPTPLTIPLLYDEFVTSSTDGGLTFSANQRISEVTADSTVGFSTPFIGDYSGLAATNDFVFPTWVDTRRNQQDIYTQRLDLVQGQKTAPIFVESDVPFTYSIRLNSPADVANNQVTDPIPAGTSYVAGSASATSGVVGFSSGAVTWLGDISSGNPITITFNVTPIATACLPITNTALLTTGQGVNIELAATSIVTGPLPVPDFSWVSSQLVFTFTNSTSGTEPLDYIWDFGDGITSTEISPVHAYTLPGDYLVTLAAANLCGSAMISHAINAACSAPEPGFGWLNEQLTVTFTNQTSGQFPLSFLWDFGDGLTSTLTSPVHVYSLAETFNVNLIATDVCGSGIFSDLVTTTCTAPSANFTWQNQGLLVSFTNQSEGTPPFSYFWDFGDGSNSDEQSPTHLYAVPGRYSVLLTIGTPCGSATFQSFVQAGNFIFLPLTTRQ